jgi:hypothetical protein
MGCRALNVLMDITTTRTVRIANNVHLVRSVWGAFASLAQTESTPMKIRLLVCTARFYLQAEMELATGVQTGRECEINYALTMFTTQTISVPSCCRNQN